MTSGRVSDPTNAMHRQFIRYGITGLVANAIMFLGFALATEFGMGHKTAMSLFYVLNVIQTFAFNRRWTFRHGGGFTGSFLRYAVAYLIGYVANFAGLVLFVDTLGLPHLTVQAALIVVIAVLLFLLQKYWVFREGGNPALLNSQT